MSPSVRPCLTGLFSNPCGIFITKLYHRWMTLLRGYQHLCEIRSSSGHHSSTVSWHSKS